MGFRTRIPNAITSMNLLCGAVGVIFAFKGRLDIAFLMMLAAALCDTGKELDSLSDVVSFGVLPSMMLFNLMAASHGWGNALCYIPLLIAAFSALRLAKFNLDERQSHSFIGLPTPASALLCGSLCHLVTLSPDSFLASWAAGDVFIPLLSVVLCALLVSSIPMFSLKFGAGHKLAARDLFKVIFVLAVIAGSALWCILGHISWSAVVLCSFCAYILENIILAFFSTSK